MKNEDKIVSHKVTKKISTSFIKKKKENNVNILDDIVFVDEPFVTFPQADNFEKCISVLELLKNGEKTNMDVSDSFGYVLRQGNYYADACRYLGLVEKSGIMLHLSSQGWKIVNLDLEKRNIELVKIILSHKVFYDAYTSNTNDVGEIVSIMKKNNALGKLYSDSTYRRRALTVINWCNWIKRQLG